MLTLKEKERLNHKVFIAEHLQYFCQKWSNDPECPEHFEDMMRRFITLNLKEQKQYYIIDDTLYTVDQVAERYQLFNPNNNRYSERAKGWYKTT